MNEEKVITQILQVAERDERIRVVVLTGSRADPNATKDIFQDFDIVFIVAHIETFIKDKQWIGVFGERLILQLPDEMTIGRKDDHAFHYLMLLKDHTRIDLTLFPLEKVKKEFKRDGHSRLLLDKDNLFTNLSAQNAVTHIIEAPTEKEFKDCCNEFWWVSTYVAKGLWRNETTYAKEMMEISVRRMFLKILEWFVGVRTGFKVSFGVGGKNLRKNVSAELYEKILATYPDSNTDNIWNSLLLMTRLFDELAREIADTFSFRYNGDEAKNVGEYLQWVKSLPTVKEN